MCDENNTYSYVEVQLKMANSCGYSVGCIICGESVKLDEMEVLQLQHGHPIHSKVCDKCKKAVLYIRDQTERGNI